MSDQLDLTAFVLWATEKLQINRQISDLRSAHPGLTKDELADKWADKICWLYATEGAVTALPSAIPGIGTMAQIGIEVGAISADLTCMLVFMVGMVSGVGQIYERDTEAPFNQEFVKILGLWCGVFTLGREPVVRVAAKVAVAQFKRVPGEVFKRINQKVGATIVTKFGMKRGGIAVGRLVPFGVGALVGGGFNFVTMNGFKQFAIDYYKTENGSLVKTEDKTDDGFLFETDDGFLSEQQA